MCWLILTKYICHTLNKCLSVLCSYIRVNGKNKCLNSLDISIGNGQKISANGMRGTSKDVHLQTMASKGLIQR